MTAIQKMVEWLENESELTSGKLYPKLMIEYCLNQARRLALEEAKSKPQAEAGLVEELWKFHVDGSCTSGAYREMEGILSRYRPTSQGDIVLWEGEAKTGQPDFSVLKGHGDNESVCLVPVPYKLIKGKKGQILFRTHKGEKI